MRSPQTMLRRVPARRRGALVLSCLVVGATLAAMPARAHAQSASVTVTGAGLLAFKVVPANVTFPAATLNGSTTTVAQGFALDIADRSAGGNGWNVTVSASTMTAGAHALPMASIPAAPAPEVCDGGPGTCTPATTTIGYPLILSAAASVVVNAAVGSGLGDGTITPVFDQVVPGNAYAGSYTATWTVTLNSGP